MTERSTVEESRGRDRSIYTRLDVRGVEPKDRFNLIIGTYESLHEGTAVELIVDHDHECMYFTLHAKRGDEAFSFEYLEDGPLDWRVRVVKHWWPPRTAGTARVRRLKGR